MDRMQWSWRLRNRVLLPVIVLLVVGKTYGETLCSPFTGEHDPVYYCWLVDPCIEDLEEAPRFHFAEACSGTDCATLPSEYQTCAEWTADDGIQSCTSYGPLATCCKYKTCSAGLECLDIVPGASICRTLPSSPDPVETPSPSLREMPPHAPPPPPPPMPISLIPTQSAVPVEPVPSPMGMPQQSPSPVSLEMSVSVEPSPMQPYLPSLPIGNSPQPSLPPSPSLPEEPVSEQTPELNPSPSVVVQTASSPATTVEETDTAHEEPSWGTAALILLVSAAILFVVALLLERKRDDKDEDSNSEDNEMAVDERFWQHLSSQCESPFLQMERNPKKLHKKSKRQQIP